MQNALDCHKIEMGIFGDNRTYCVRFLIHKEV